MDLQLGRQGAHGRERLSSLKLPANDRLLGCEDDLIEDRLAGPELEPERCHIDNVTHALSSELRSVPTRAEAGMEIIEIKGLAPQSAAPL
jgi:hypothetical protein